MDSDFARDTGLRSEPSTPHQPNATLNGLVQRPSSTGHSTTARHERHRQSGSSPTQLQTDLRGANSVLIQRHTSRHIKVTIKPQTLAIEKDLLVNHQLRALFHEDSKEVEDECLKGWCVRYGRHRPQHDICPGQRSSHHQEIR